MTALLPDFIQLGEGMIARRVRAIEMLTDYNLTDSDRDSGGVFNLPADFLGIRAILGTYESQEYALAQKSLNELRSFNSGSPPFFYTQYGLQIEIRGTPSATDTYDLLYFERPDALSVTASNTLFDNHPGLYVHSSLYYLHLKAQDLELANEHKTQFNAEVEAANTLAANQRGSAQVAKPFNYGLINARSSM